LFEGVAEVDLPSSHDEHTSVSTCGHIDHLILDEGPFGSAIDTLE
jgi:hypothetical protein